VIGETVAQVKGAKPRFKPAGKTSEITRQRVSELSEAYLEARNAKLRSQAFLAEAQAKEKVGELISRELVSRQAQYIFLCLRQSILNFPVYARRIIGLSTLTTSIEHQAREVLTKAAREFLTELADSRRKPSTPTGSRSSKPMASRERSLFAVRRAASKSRLKRRRPSGVGNRRQRRCENFAPKAEVIGIIEVVDDVLAGSNLCQGFLAQQAPAFWRFL
jgi:hypothetical protein